MTHGWRVKDVMATLAIIAIYLAAFRSLTLGPSGDLFTTWQWLVSIVLLLIILPFHVMAAYVWIIERWFEKR